MSTVASLLNEITVAPQSHLCFLTIALIHRTSSALFLLTSLQALQYSPFPTLLDAMIVAFGNQEVGDETEVTHRAAILLPSID